MTSPTTNRTRRAARASSVAARRDDRENQYDLLTAALMGMAVGAGLTFMLRRGPSGRRPVTPVFRGAGRAVAWAGRNAWRAGRRGASWAGDRGGELWEQIPRDEIRDGVSRRLSDAREAIDDAVESELHSLRKAVRRRRKQLGL